MKNYEISNYALASSHNPRYIFLLKSPQLISNQQIYFDETAAFIDGHQEPRLQPMTYYYLKFVITNRKNNKIKIIEAVPLALLGSEWQSQNFVQHMLKFQGSLKQPQPNNPFMKEQMENGELRVNDEGWIYVKSLQSGFRKKLKLVNNYYAVPLLKGWKVDYFLRKYAEDEGPKVKISRLSFQNLTLAGILKMINGRIFFQPRHCDYQRMIPLALPQALMDIIYQCLPHYKGTLPYTIFKRFDGDHNLVNKHLSQYVLQGKFIDWPLKFSHPVITIVDIQPMTCINLKQATLYELGIPIQDYDAEENRLSNQIIKNFDPFSYSDRLTVTDRCYTFDCEGGNCYDDAFSFRQTQRGYNVSIHISDVPALVEGKSYLLERAHIRDQTIYIKNYYKSMFPEQLRDVMSLMALKPRLAFSLSFDLAKDGKIDYYSITFQQTIIKVAQNITHGDKISNHQDQATFLGLVAALKKSKEGQKVLTFDDIDTSIATAQLLFISSNIPTFIFNQNLKRLPGLIKHIQQHLSALYCEASQYLKPSQSLAEASSQELSSSLKYKSNKISPQSLVVDKSQKYQDVLPTSAILKDLQSNISSQSSGQREDYQELDPDSELEAQQRLSPNQRARTIGSQNNQFFRKVSSKEGSAAECYRFLDKLFRAADIFVDYTHPKNIENALKDCEKKHKDKIAELYFRTKLIMSKQHFQTIARLCNEGKLKEFDLNSHFNSSPLVYRSNQGVQKVEESQSTDKTAQIASILSSQVQNTKIQEIQATPINFSNVEKLQDNNVENNVKQVEIKLQVNQKQHQISALCNHLTYLLESHQHSLCKSKPQQLQQVLTQLKKIAKEKNIRIIDKSNQQRMKDLNNEILVGLPKEQSTEPKDVKPFKWNTPIRSGSSLHALTLLKNYSWIFNGTMAPLTALKHQSQVSVVKQYMNKIYKERSRQQSMELNGRMKTACRELDKIDFLFVLRQQPDRVWDFLTITSPSNRVQFVYHQFIEEVEVDNPQKNVIYYTRVKGRFKGIFDFPIKLKVVLLQK